MAAGETVDGPFVPEAGDLARAQRCLNRITGFPNAAPAALGDSGAWLAERRRRLEQAKGVRGLAGADVARLVREARRGDASVAGALSRLLVAEALCVNGLPASPSGGLVALGAPAVGPVLGLLRGGETPAAARALAALTLGAVAPGTDRPGGLGAWETRAFAWGTRRGLPSDPALVAALLADGDNAAERGLRTVEAGGSLGFSAETLREMLADGLPPAAVVGLAEAARDAETVAERLLSVRRDLPHPPGRHADWTAMLEKVRAPREAAVRELGEALAAYARATHDPAVLRRIAEFWHRMFDLTGCVTDRAEAVAAVVEQAREVTRMGLELPSAAQRDYWDLLVERHGVFWDPTALRPDPRPAEFRDWLLKALRRHVSRLRALLALSGDRATVAAAFDLDIHGTLAAQNWMDPELYRLFVTLARELDLTDRHGGAYDLGPVLGTFADAAEARPYFQALLQPLRAYPPLQRQHVLETLWDEAGYTRQAVRQRVPRVLPLLPALARFSAGEEQELVRLRPRLRGGPGAHRDGADGGARPAGDPPVHADALAGSDVGAGELRTHGSDVAVALMAHDSARFGEAVRARRRGTTSARSESTSQTACGA